MYILLRLEEKKMPIKSKNKNLIKRAIYVNNSGMALIATLIFVIVLIAFGTGLLALTNNDSKLSTLHRESNRAFYIAEKGIEKALYNLNEDDNYPMTSEGGKIAWRPTDFSEGTSEESFLVTISNIGILEGKDNDEEVIKIISKGIVNKGKFSSATRTIEVKAEKDRFMYPKYKYAILTDKLIYGHQSPIIEGDIHSNDEIRIPGIESGKLEFDGTATCSGDVNEITEENVSLPIVPVPTINYGGLEIIAESEGIEHIHVGDEGEFEILKGETINWSGLHYIKGNLRLKNSAILNITNGAVIIEGEVTMDNDAAIIISKPEDREDIFYTKEYAPLAIVATGQIVLQNSSTSINGVVQSIQKNGDYLQPQNKVIIKNNATVIGSVIGAEVELKNDGKIIYDEETLSIIMELGDEFYKKVSWQEK